MEFTSGNTITAVHTTIGIDVSLAIPHPDGFGGADSHAGCATGAVVLQDLYGMKVFTIFLIHGILREVDYKLNQGRRAMLGYNMHGIAVFFDVW